nr:vacuolar protein sorting-associated protein 36 [Tanacetum cinerariifolium]
MTLVQEAGKPDIFLTMTCNPNWPEIMKNLYEGQTAQDRPDLVTTVFHAKLEYLKYKLFTKHILGVVASHVYVIEFQKRGLPHAHFLLIMRLADKLPDPDHYDKGEPKKCHWNYPRQFQETRQQGDDSYPLYRRRDNDIEVNVRNNVLDNRWVVPYNPKSLILFNCHINVEVYSSIKSVKYVFNYVYKGHDKQVVNVDQDGKEVLNEIKRFQDARYVSPPEAMWRIYGFPLSNIHPSVMSLQVHLPNKQLVRFAEDDELTDILERQRDKRSMLTVFFDLNKTDTHARQYLYKDIPKAALKRGLIKSDIYIHACLRESSAHEMPGLLRRLFATLLIFCEPGDVRKLWDDHYESLLEDYNLDCASIEQKNAYDTIMRHVDADSLGVFFIDGPGGTGKTFLYKSLLATVRSRGLIALATSSSGAAENNMTRGRTTRSQVVEAVDRTIQDITGVKLSFGGKIIVLGWDFRQVLSVVRRGTRAQIVDSSLRMSPLWTVIKKMWLNINMRARTDSWFSNFLLRVSDGVKEVIDEDYVRISDDMTIPYTDEATSKDALINEIFSSFATSAHSSANIVSRAILSTKNEHIDNINDLLIDKFHAKRRNLDPTNELCNGTRLICKRFDPNVINAEIAAGQHTGVRVLLPRIPLAPSEEDMFPFKLKRTQFPVRLSFAMTINKAMGKQFQIHGQTIPNVGVYLPDSIFSHGQLYVALSRGISRTTTKVLVKPEKEFCQEVVYTSNVVYQEVLRDE